MTVKEAVLKNHSVFQIEIINNDYRKFYGDYADFLLKFSGTDVWNTNIKGYFISEDKNLLELWLQ